MGRLVVDTDKKPMLLGYCALFLMLVVWGLFFFLHIFPFFLPTIFPERIWAIWLISGLFFGPPMLLIFYVVVRMTGSLWQFNRTQWKIAIIGTPLGFMFLAALGYVFSLVIPTDFEPFRSCTLPSLAFIVVIIIISRMKFIKKYQVTQKRPS